MPTVCVTPAVAKDKAPDPFVVRACHEVPSATGNAKVISAPLVVLAGAAIDTLPDEEPFSFNVMMPPYKFLQLH